VRKSANWLKTTLVTAAWTASRKKGSYLQALFHRPRAGRGAKNAVVAVAASMLTAAYFMLRDGVEFRDLGSRHCDGAIRSRPSTDSSSDSPTSAATSKCGGMGPRRAS